MSKATSLQVKKGFLPAHIELPFDGEECLRAAQDELQHLAEFDGNESAVYIPRGQRQDRSVYPGSSRFMRTYSFVHLGFQNMTYSFALLKLSMRKQESLNGMHVDSISRTGISPGGIAERPDGKRLWVVILNLSDQEDRTLRYSHQQPVAEEAVDIGGLLTFTDFDEREVEDISINPRTKDKIYGVTFCASEVMHSAVEYGGHFVGRYVKVENAA